MGRANLQLWIFLLFVPWITCCSQPQSKKENAAKTTKPFTLPVIPSGLTEPAERAGYLATHYWQNFDFSDTTLISKPEITEQALADFLDILPHTTPENAEKSLTQLMSSAAADSAMLAHFISLTEKYLYDPNSPFRNEAYYIPVLQYLVSSDKLDDLHKIRPQHQLTMALKNRPGQVAADFVYTLANGKKSRMKDLPARLTVLFFNNPDCEDCKRVKEYMAASPLFNPPIPDRSALTILAVYPDADLSLWRRASYPPFIINSYDPGGEITKKQLYDLRAIPTLYLLGSDKQVILKDASIEQIEEWIGNATQRF